MFVETLQGYNLRTFKGRIDPDLSPWKNNPIVSSAIATLKKRIGEDQFVWCTQSGQPLERETGRYLHGINVDERDVVAVVDTLVWCRIIGYSLRHVPEEELDDLKSRAYRESGDCEGDYTELLEHLIDKYLADNLPDDLWAAVIKEECTKASDQLLVRFPLKYYKIVNADIVTEEMAKGVG